MSTSMTSGEGPDDRPGSQVPFKKLNQAANDLNVVNEQAQTIGAAWAKIENTDMCQAISRRLFRK
jgi:hypothetical protein